MWYKDAKQIKPTVIADHSNNNEKYEIKTAAVSDNGKYECSVTFGVYGEVKSASSKTQYVRSVEMAAITYGVKGKTIELACPVYGDAPNTISFKKGSTAISDDSNYDLVNGNYVSADFKEIDSLKILASDTTDAATDYKCEVAWTSGPALTKTATGEVKVSSALSKFTACTFLYSRNSAYVYCRSIL